MFLVFKNRTGGVMLEVFPIMFAVLPIIIGLAILWVLVTYFMRFVKAHEEISDSFQEISESLKVIASKSGETKNL